MPSRSRWLVGSSRNSRSGLRASSRAMARRRFQPPESASVRTRAVGEAGAAEGLVDARGALEVVEVLAGDGVGDHFGGASGPRERRRPAARSRRACCGAARPMPESGSSCPARISSSVDLPEPFGPMRPRRSPSEMPSEMFSNRSAGTEGLGEPGAASEKGHYSYRRASTGSRRAAFVAGQTPKKTPIDTETLKPVISAQEGTLRGQRRQQRADQHGDPHGDHDAQQAARSGERHGLDQKLPDDVAAARAERFADADFARALGDADQHDIHHADAAHQQAERGNRDGHQADQAGDRSNCWMIWSGVEMAKSSGAAVARRCVCGAWMPSTSSYASCRRPGLGLGR